VLFYRGSWCPYCNAQLRAFQRAYDDLAAIDTRVVALIRYVREHGTPGRGGC